MLRFGVEFEVAKIDQIDPPVNGWMAKCDGSIHPYGSEFVSPIFEWEQRDQVFKVIDFIKSRRGKCNKSCGLHVHMSGQFGLEYDPVRKIAGQWYKEIENGFTPSKNRRDNYCTPQFSGYTDRKQAVRLVDIGHFARYGAMHIEVRLFNAHMCKRWVARCLWKTKELGDNLERQLCSSAAIGAID